jgi:hypothetical protein
MISECSAVPEPMLAAEVLQPWRDTLLGIKDVISEDNERSWKATLQRVCERLLKEGRVGKSQAEQFKCRSDDREWLPWTKSNIVGLWDEQVVVATAVLKSIQDGVEF